MAAGSSRMVLRDDEHEPNQEVVKCVVVGDTNVGKTKLVCAQACGTRYTMRQLMQTAHVSTVWALDHYKFDQEVRDKSWLSVDDVSVSLRLWDTFGYHDKDRKFAYGSADVILVCFSLVKPISLRNVKHIWHREITKLCPGIPVVLCGCQADLRYLYLHEDFVNLAKGPFFKAIQDSDLIYPDVGRGVAKQILAPYYETSVLTRTGIPTLFQNVTRIALIERRKHRFWSARLKSIQKPLPQAPCLPPKPELHSVLIPTNLLTEDFSGLLTSDCYTDVTFVVQGEHVLAHRLFLMASSVVFYNMFTDILEHDKTKIKQICKENVPPCSMTTDTARLLSCQASCGRCDESRPMSLLSTVADAFTSCTSLHASKSKNWGSSDRASGRKSCIWRKIFTKVEIPKCNEQVAKCNEPVKSCSTLITVDDSVTPSVFRSILCYLYSGNAVVLKGDLSLDVIKTAKLLQLDKLVAMVTNEADGESMLNEGIKQAFYQQRRKQFCDVFLHSGFLADVEFQLDDGCVAAHKPLLVARCEMMEAMFTDNFREGSAKVVSFPNVGCSSFSALLEYLYTGQCPSLHDVDVIDVIEVANRLCLPHLVVLVENHVIRQLTSEEEGGEDIVEDTLYLLESAQLHNAWNLAAFCLHYLSINYSAVYRRHHKLLKSLSDDNQCYLAKHRWPPVWYIKEVDYYDRNSREMEQSRQQSILTRKRQRSSSGCLCFVGRNRSKYTSDIRATS